MDFTFHARIVIPTKEDKPLELERAAQFMMTLTPAICFVEPMEDGHQALRVRFQTHGEDLIEASNRADELIVEAVVGSFEGDTVTDALVGHPTGDTSCRLCHGG